MNASSVRPFSYPDVTPSIHTGPAREIDSIGQMQLELSALAGFRTASLSAVLGWKIGDVLELDRAATEPVDLQVQGQLVGRGHIVIVDDEISVRVAEIVDGRSELI